MTAAVVLGLLVAVLLLVVAYLLAGSDRRARRAYLAGFRRGRVVGGAEAWLAATEEAA